MESTWFHFHLTYMSCRENCWWCKHKKVSVLNFIWGLVLHMTKCTCNNVSKIFCYYFLLYLPCDYEAKKSYRHYLLCCDIKLHVWDKKTICVICLKFKIYFLQSETKVHHKDTCSLANNHKLEEPVDENKGLDELLHFINGTDTQKGETIEEKALSAKAAKRARQKQRKVCNANRIKLINIRISYLQFLYLSYLRQSCTTDHCSLVFFFLSIIMLPPFRDNIVFVLFFCPKNLYMQILCTF